jgi:hypothetical protein
VHAAFEATARSHVPDNGQVTATNHVLLPKGSLLLHIGPHKTGTTSVQSAFHTARRELARHGVRYAGPDRHPVVAAQAAIEAPGGGPRRARSIGSWRAILREVTRARRDRVVLSSEWFADAEPEAIGRIVGDLDPTRVHVVVTLRSLAQILPSQWQQYVAAGSTLAYEPWLESIFGAPAQIATPTFWHRHRHDRLVARWAEVVGPGNVTAVVVDDRDRGAVLRAFEDLVGIPRGTLAAEPDRLNRSFTFAETELLRALNAAFGRAIDDANLRLNLGLYGTAAAMRLREPGPTEPRIETPAWATQRAAEVQREIVDGIERLGMRVIGDLRWLQADRGVAIREPRRAPAEDAGIRPEDADAWTEDADAWPEVAAAAGMGALAATGLARGSGTSALRPLSTERLARVAYQRVRDGMRLRLRALPSGPSTVPTPSAADRPLTPREHLALDRFRVAILAEGLSASLYDRLVREGAIPEMQRSVAPAAVGVDARSPAWPEIGSALVMGVVRASGLLGRGAAGRSLPPPRARIETLEVARVSTPVVALVVLWRVLAGLPGRLLPRAGS